VSVNADTASQSDIIPVPELEEKAIACAERLHAAECVLIASHIDADGLTSAAIAAKALERANIPCETVFAKQLDANEIKRIAATDYDTILFTDFGSGQLDIMDPYVSGGHFEAVIADHHQPALTSDDNPAVQSQHHLNPLLVGIDGASELSGAGASYVLARALANASTEENNRDLAALAVVGAVGDMQSSVGGLTGANAAIVEEGVAAGVIEETTDLRIYGRQTRPLPKLLEYASDVQIPGITNNESGVATFLNDIDIQTRSDGEWRRWIDLTMNERQTVVSGLIDRAIASGVPGEQINDLVGTTYTLTAEAPGTELRDVSEFSTLLNATARYDRADVGLAVCLGNRGAALTQARHLLQTHRQNLSEGLQWVTSEGTTTESNIQWFDAGGRIRETIVGIVAGMAVGGEGIQGDLPILAFAEKSDTEIKVSARGSQRLVRNGLDLSAVMQKAASAVGGEGGGHDIAAGATIPMSERSTFVEIADKTVGEQV
jgi:Single-stranded DNA-specific exonuclease